MTGVHDLVPAYEALPEDDVYAVLGAALLDSGIGVGPSDPGRLRRFARAWFEAKRDELWHQVRASDTYRIWAASAGPGQAVESHLLAETFAGQEGDVRLEAALAVALSRDQLQRDRQTYDVAVSAADGESAYVAEVVSVARNHGLRVFYDKDMTSAWWGKNFLAEGRKIYGQLAWHFVPFISAAYLVETGPRDAFDAAMAAAIERGDDYILPVLIGDVRVPPEMLHPQIGYLRAEDYTPAELAEALRVKVSTSKARGASARDFGSAVREAQDYGRGAEQSH